MPADFLQLVHPWDIDLHLCSQSVLHRRRLCCGKFVASVPLDAQSTGLSSVDAKFYLLVGMMLPTVLEFRT